MKKKIIFFDLDNVICFTDKNKNSLSQILKIIKAINTIVPQGMNGLDGMDEEFEFE